MNSRQNSRPIIIKRKKFVTGAGHHGGAWKVAYADFVTAMMAFFMLMWLLNATTEQQRKGIADYFSPTIPITRISGGGDGSFGGSSVFSEMTTAQNGTGATTLRPTEGRQALGTLGSDHSKEEKDQALLGIEAAIMGAMDAKDEESHDHLSHLQISSSDEGLVIEIFEREDLPLFVGGDGGASAWLADMLEILSGLLNAVENDVAITAHVAAESPVRAGPGPWERSFANAQTIRNLLIKSNLEPSRILRMTGFADRAPVTQDPMLRRNNRIEIIVLRQG